MYVFLDVRTERDALNRPLIIDGCCRGTPRAKQVEMDLLYPEEKAAMKDPAEALLEVCLCLFLCVCQSVRVF
jgi:hypothetical protein